MSMGPAEDYEHHTDPSDAAEPTRPSERGAWRGHWDDEDDAEAHAVKRRPVMPTWWLEDPPTGRKSAGRP